MNMPYLNEIASTRELIDTFGGYNHNLSIGSGELFDMRNLCGDHYPILSTRPSRGLYAMPLWVQGMISKENLCYIDGGDMVIGEEHYPMALSATEKPKTMISMGAYVIILPDKKYINTSDPADRGDIEATVVSTDHTVISLCRADASEYGEIPTGETPPENPAAMDLWIDTGETPHTLKQYDAAGDRWVTVSATYLKISSPGLGAPFAAGDGVTLLGLEGEAATLCGTHTVVDRGEDYLVIAGLLDCVTEQNTPITATRRMPEMDFVIEAENRLWGCRCGKDAEGRHVNEIYASKLGDFKNWNCFEGISTDSYAVSVGSDGPFTGAAVLDGRPIFFKESCMHKIYGSYPAEYRLQTTACRGVQQGCERSLAVVGETLYYKSRAAVCAYDGSLPVEISAALGDVRYHGAVAGALRNKYYISMLDEEETPHLFVYDTRRGTWHLEDDLRVSQFCAHGGELYLIDESNGAICTVGGTGETEDSVLIPWMAQSGLIGTSDPDQKYLSRLDIRLSMEAGASADVFVEYDSCGEWEHILGMETATLRTYSVPIRLRRCDHLRLRLEGCGRTQIFSICKTMEKGGYGDGY